MPGNVVYVLLSGRHDYLTDTAGLNAASSARS